MAIEWKYSISFCHWLSGRPSPTIPLICLRARSGGSRWASCCRILEKIASTAAWKTRSYVEDCREVRFKASTPSLANCSQPSIGVQWLGDEEEEEELPLVQIWCCSAQPRVVTGLSRLKTVPLMFWFILTGYGSALWAANHGSSTAASYILLKERKVSVVSASVRLSSGIG